MYRQFVNLIVKDQRTTLYSMRRLGIIPHLFHESPLAEAQDAAANKKGSRLSTISSCNLLPRSEINFALQPKIADSSTMHYFSLLRGQGDGCVMFTAPYGQTTVYDADLQSVILVPQPKFFMRRDSIALSIAGCSDSLGVGCEDHHQLYVMGSSEGNSSFEVFNYCRVRAPTVGLTRWWSWAPLPPPPQVQRRYWPEMRPSAAAVVDETMICVSSVDGGAYTFDTAERLWRQAGSWVLPFHGAAEYVPELGLWFGLEDADGNPRHRLCAFDLSLSSWPPVVRHSWDYLDDGLPDGWLPEEAHLVNLGSGRFCIATRFQAAVKHRTVLYGFSSDEDQVELEYGEATLLTGVDVVRSGSGALEMIKHKSRLYDIEDMSIHCVL